MFSRGHGIGSAQDPAMQIIEELEPTRRGPYAGAVGYFGFSGNMDTCITIRTLVIKEGVAYIQAGGGVVADSDPAAEYQETVNKAKAMMRAVEMAEKGLD
jgi:anthranilate synthase component 1